MKYIHRHITNEITHSLGANPVVAIIGRPNVGKSMYINRLLNSERVIVADVPGTTRDSIDVPFTVGKNDSFGQTDVGLRRLTVDRHRHNRAGEGPVAIGLQDPGRGQGLHLDGARSRTRIGMVVLVVYSSDSLGMG